MFRSAKMSLVEIYVPSEEARHILHEIGILGVMQFRDLNKGINDFQRSFVQELRVLDNIERQYWFLKSQLDKKSIEIVSYPYDVLDIQMSDIEVFSENAALLENRVSQMSDAFEALQKKRMELIQCRYTIETVKNFFTGNDPHGLSLMPLSEDSAGLHSQFISGVIDRDKVGVFQQILWRVLRGNMYYYTEEIQEPIYDPKKGEDIFKSTFVIFSHGTLIRKRIIKIAESLNANIYEIELNAEQRLRQLRELDDDLSDLKLVLQETDSALSSELIAVSRDLARWWEVIAREKRVYQIMNLCDYDGSRKTIIAEGWVPNDEIPKLTETVRSSSSSDAVPTIINVLETSKTPPTYHRTNKFSVAFQSICDTYGVASYQEINPGLPTIITFPFMFAIMFGDLGHGFLMFLAAAVLVFKEEKIKSLKRDEIFDMAFSGRYILLLMGFFSMYTGLMYNDIFSKSLTLFKSGWQWPSYWEDGQLVFAKQIGVYPFGLDWAWHGSENALLFSNSYKMKLSVLMGYLHMTFSYFFSLSNAIYFGEVIDIVGNFIPGLLFMQSIFGYLSLCIVYKWSVDWLAIKQQPPGLLNMLIMMFLSPGSVVEPLYSHQSGVQITLLAIALVCVPWLVLVKPLYLRHRIRQKEKSAIYESLVSRETEHESHQAVSSSRTATHGTSTEDDEDSDESETFGDIMIHQVIHTIEFCLNCVSHTASYLRLWALSLAHAQLSTVLWTMTLENAFGMTGIVGVFLTVFLFGMWFCLTVVILVIMEGTSAMLHSLRLHWVESMSKFFIGEGTLYQPFNFKDLNYRF
ncbi:H(+)-transporting V0 sector ATPase subunit a [Candidozyma auris]